MARGAGAVTIAPMPDDCSICRRLADCRAGRHPLLIAELETGYAVLGDDQRRRGWTLLLCKVHASELHELDGPFRVRFLQDMALLAEAVWRATAPLGVRKLNYELLGNADPHLHWHVFPRLADDPAPTQPIWGIDPTEFPTLPTPAETAATAEAIRREVERLRAG